MKDQLKRILSLVRKTGDTMIVTDPGGKDAYVVMDLDQYELFLGFSADQEPEDAEDFESQVDEDFRSEELDLPQGQPEQPFSDEIPDVWGMMPSAGEEAETWDLNQLSDQERAELERQYQVFVARNVQEAVEDTAPESESVTEAVSESVQEQAPQTSQNEEDSADDDFGEEQFYLEPIE